LKSGAYFLSDWVARAKSVTRVQSPAAIASPGTSQEPPTHTTLGRAKNSGAFCSVTPPVGKTHVKEWTAPGFEHGRATGLHCGEKLEFGKAVFLRHHDFAAAGHTGQQGQTGVAAGLAHRAGVTRADGEARTCVGRGLCIGLGTHRAGTDHRLRYFTCNGFNAGQRLRRAQRNFQHTDATGHQRTGHGDGVGHIVQHDDRNHRCIGHHLQGGEFLGGAHNKSLINKESCASKPGAGTLLCGQRVTAHIGKQFAAHAHTVGGAQCFGHRG